MKVKTKEVREITGMLDDIIEQYKEDHPKKERDWRTYEQRFAHRVKTAYRELRPLVQKACSSLQIMKGEARGAESKLTLEQKVLLLLIKHIIQKSNRDISGMLAIFSCLSDIDVSYKTVERLYSDHAVICALHNLHTLILKRKGIKKANCGGDGTGYALTVKKHYASEAQKLKDKLKAASGQKIKKRKKRLFVYAFNLLDLDENIYLATGTSFKSENDAFQAALAMAEDLDIGLSSLRLDRYYSTQGRVELIGEKLGKLILYLIPKKNATVKGSWDWKRMLARFVENTQGYLEEYFQRNKSESGFAEDKKRCGWQLGQKREDRIDTANFLTMVWHNLYNLG